MVRIEAPRVARLVPFLLLLATPAFPADGRIEINQAIVDAAGGFPFTIGAPGTYVLTSDLTVATDVTAISVAPALNVSIDLNGFRILGPHSCVPGACGAGTAAGIVGGTSNVVIQGGQVSSFSGSCISVGSGSRVERMRVFACGRHGIAAGITSRIASNIVSGAGEDGIHLSDRSSIYAHNTVTFAGLGGGGGVPIRGGRATAGNACDDGSCSPTGARRFYLTPDLHTGATAGQACTAGFHLAQLSEIWDTSGLHYDASLGLVVPGERGAPMGTPYAGWLYASDDDDTVDCANYSSASGTGRTAGLFHSFDLGPWRSATIGCGLERQVWCVED